MHMLPITIRTNSLETAPVANRSKFLNVFWSVVIGTVAVSVCNGQVSSVPENLPVFPKGVVRLENSVIFLNEQCKFDMAVATNSLEAGLSSLNGKETLDEEHANTAKQMICYSIIAISQFAAPTDETMKLLSNAKVQLGEQLVPKGMLLPSQYFQMLMGVSFKTESGNSLDFSPNVEQPFSLFIDRALLDIEARKGIKE